MKRAELEALLSRYGIAPSKALGQNFLIDENFLDYIARETNAKPEERILEVGPGLGVLTTRLIASGANVTAIELDRKLAAYLRTSMVPRGLHLIEGDACKVDIPAIFQGEDFRLISNLPYSAGTVILANMLTLENPPKDMIVLLQKEVGLRFAAAPGTDDYGALSVRMQASYQVEILKGSIPGELFYPKPEVDSALVRFVRKEPVASAGFRKFFGTFVRTGFAHRRKKMYKQLTAVADPDRLAEAMKACDVDMDIRAERVTVPQFIRMAEMLYKES